MGICYSGEDAKKTERSCQIDKQLEKEKIKQEYKILLLGSGESGKSTILKQMKIINQNGYTKDELRSWRTIVYQNLIQSAQALVQAILAFDLKFDNGLNNEYAIVIKNYKFSGDSRAALDVSLIEAIESVWADATTKFCVVEKASEFYLMDSAPYFFDDIKRIAKIGYIPNEKDVLRARLKTTGITEIKFAHEKHTSIQ
ncbi:hypothetical protein G6F42_023851 [Rhizopus arrhizus]|nr:hypothetical protein G6F42_023851 [Rhizopus arrhizus]